MSTAPVPSGAPPSALHTSLEPVRRALLEDASRDAAAIIGEATRSADLLVADAEHETENELRRARRRGQASARAHADLTLARAANDARRVVLHAQKETCRRLRAELHAAASSLRHDPRYPDLLDRLEAMARAQLGRQARIERDPEPDGGVIGVADDHRVDYTLPRLADRALDALADAEAALWS